MRRPAPTLFMVTAVYVVALAAHASEAELVYAVASPTVAVVETDHGRLGGAVAWHANNGVTFLYTNCHTLAGARALTIRRKSDRAPAHFLYGDAKSDLCVIVTAMSIEIAKRREFQDLRVGESVYAIGSPRGLELSLSTGVISRLQGFPFLFPPALVQTTAAISPGSSGGGLFDSRGRLIGITSFYLKESQGLNFAVSPDTLSGVPDDDLAKDLADLDGGPPADVQGRRPQRPQKDSRTTPSQVRQVDAAINANAKLRYVRSHRPEVFNEIVEVDDFVRAHPRGRSLTLEDRFRRSVFIWEVMNGAAIVVPPDR